MKHNLLFYIFLFALLTGCTNTKQNVATKTYEYEHLYTVNYPYFESATSDLNRSVEKAATEWLSEDTIWFGNKEFEVDFVNEEILVVHYIIDAGTESRSAISIIQMFDMISGQRIYGQELASSLGINAASLTSNTARWRSEEEAQRVLDYAFMSESEYMNEMSDQDPYAMSATLSYLINKPCFYIKNDQPFLKTTIDVWQDIEFDPRTGEVIFAGPTG